MFKKVWDRISPTPKGSSPGEYRRRGSKLSYDEADSIEEEATILPRINIQTDLTVFDDFGAPNNAILRAR